MLAGILASIVAAVVPTLFYTLLVWGADRYEREPTALLVAAFVWGALPAIVVAIILETVLGIPLQGISQSLIGETLNSAVIAPVIEETIKGFALLAVMLVFAREFDGVLDGIVYGSVIGFGFAMTENVLYFIGSFSEQGVGTWVVVVLLRGVVFGLNHAFFTALTGIGLGAAAYNPVRWKRIAYPVIGLGAAIGFHAVHNLGASLVSVSWLSLFISVISDWGGVLLVIGVIVWAWRSERRWLRDELAGEVGAMLSPAEYETYTSYGARALLRLNSIRGLRSKPGADHQFQQSLTELAFKKHHLHQLAGSNPARAQQLVAETDQLRRGLLALREAVAASPEKGGAIET